MLRLLRRLLPVLLAAALAPAGATLAQDFPSRPIRILAPIPPGAAPDIAARLIAERIGESLRQPVVVENRSGANGNLAMEVVTTAPPDGYTLLLAADSNIVINRHVYARLPFDTLRDLIPVTSVARNQFLLAVNPRLPVRSFEEFIAYARDHRPPLAYASGGAGSQHQFAMELLRQRAGIELLHVPFRGGPLSVNATISGDTQVMFTGASSAGLLESGQLRALAASGSHRSTRFPDLPTIGEFYPGYAIDIWLGLFAPAGTPEPVVTRLRTEVQALLARPDFAERLNVSGSLEPLILSPAEFSTLIRDDDRKYGELVRALGVNLD
ncbi:Bug family tripartite tricarboxylate transporter substrate binding protein [Roseomonas sp. BN140053]|uniref:Bug family tripartite tricarboxylate transporter substrate binding protein n=1 Tax=Roseomonas sp. BN140053 TaxID=3391898 RepID=UPI0039E85571